MKIKRSIPAVLAIAFITTLPASALTLYFTEFEEFSSGYDQWVGAHGWLGTSTGVGVHGIDQDILPGLGKTAFIGFNQPAATFVTVFHPELYNPFSNATPTIEFETLMGVEDSTNGFRDSFYYSFYNSGGEFLASIQFDNTETNFGVWRLDGTTNRYDTGIEFIRGELHLLFAAVNFTNNTWSADLDGIPLFDNKPFNVSGKNLNLGFVAAEWNLTAVSTNNHGDNWMLISDWAVRALPDISIPYSSADVGVTPGGLPTMSWSGEVGYDYQVEYSDNLEFWLSGLPNSTFTNILASMPLSFIDSASTNCRAYRLMRSLAP